MKSALIVADVSGSMAEMGKHLLMCQIMRFISQLPAINPEKYGNVEFKFFSWGEEIIELTPCEDGDLFLPKPIGKGNVKRLVEWASEIVVSNPSARIMILSDGAISDIDAAVFGKWLANAGIMARSIAIGADADYERLRKFSSNRVPYPAEEIHSATDTIVFSADNPDPPKCLQSFGDKWNE